MLAILLRILAGRPRTAVAVAVAVPTEKTRNR